MDLWLYFSSCANQELHLINSWEWSLPKIILPPCYNTNPEQRTIRTLSCKHIPYTIPYGTGLLFVARNIVSSPLFTCFPPTDMNAALCATKTKTTTYKAISLLFECCELLFLFSLVSKKPTADREMHTISVKNNARGNSCTGWKYALAFINPLYILWEKSPNWITRVSWFCFDFYTELF